jgi:predicted PurR-regulated permease PerM
VTDIEDTAAKRRNRVVLAVVLAAACLLVAHGLVTAIAWAAVIAIGLDPVRRRMLATRPGSETVVAAALTAAVAVVVLAPLALGVTQAAREAGDIAAWIARARIEGVPVPTWVGSMPFQSARITDWWQGHLADPAQLSRSIESVRLGEMLKEHRHVGIDALHRILAFAFVVMSLFFMLRDRDAIIDQARTASARALGASGPRIGGQVLASVRGTIDGVVLVGLAQGAIMAVVFLIAGVPHPIAFGFAAGIGAMVPIGIMAVTCIAGFLLLIGGSPIWAALVIGFAFCIHFIAEHFVKPAMIGGTTRLPFILVLLGLVGGIETLGLLGLFMGPAVMAAGMMVWRDYVGTPDDGVARVTGE